MMKLPEGSFQEQHGHQRQQQGWKLHDAISVVVRHMSTVYRAFLAAVMPASSAECDLHNAFPVAMEGTYLKSSLRMGSGGKAGKVIGTKCHDGCLLTEGHTSRAA